MLNHSIKIIFFSLLWLLIISPAPSFAWHDYGYYGRDNWFGSGRDHSYSEYIDLYYSPSYADYYPVQPVFIDENSLAPKQQITQYPSASANEPYEFTVNIPNKHGGYTAIIIKRSGNGFVGPQGEYFPEFPKVFQLELMYGK